MTANGAIALAAGGTGGHLFPAEALAHALVSRGRRVLLVTDGRGRAWAGDFPAERVVEVPAGSLSGGLRAKATAFFRIVRGIALARAAIRSARVSAVVGFGGYPAFPASAAAVLGRLPLVLHEQNAILGRTNRVLSRFASIIATSVPDTRGIPHALAPRVHHVGNPVREAVVGSARSYEVPAADGSINIFVTGGSQGAQALAEGVPAALAQFPETMRSRLRVALQVRADGEDEARMVLQDAGITGEVAPFFSDIGERLASAHLVIARAGASTIAELSVAGRPAILVPLPTAKDDQQTINAAALSQAGAAEVVPQHEIDRLPTLLCDLLGQPDRLARMAKSAGELARPNAARDLADLVDALLANHANAGAAQAREGPA